MSGFKKFLFRGNLVELAVAVVVGAAFSGLVTAFVNSFIGPLIALVGGQPDFSRLAFSINGTRFPYGVFVTAAISFLIIASVVYFIVVLPLTKLMARMTRAEEAVERECPECLSEVPIKAARCKFCTSELVPV
ncbi:MULTISPECIES: large conductance mechanosensitive channel protein MscL [Thermomonosporaceae]|uniref:large conductance mechanosensitive channel protein MscL n=1 Tax=Thermomonosporaceae TaxID=2012 RepID=UPI00255A7CE6|nr:MULTISPECIES: large conductance mechanosensitive channel protein MscL [Thermomonosporaceae]MDL4772476.1 large conductance mechanosensitive channel protein MscL [Actinomadura xylanilytica]